MHSTCVKSRWLRREFMMECGPCGKGDKVCTGAREEKTGQESVTCSRSQDDYAAGSGQECQESLYTVGPASCLPGLVKIMPTKLTAVSAQHTELVLSTHISVSVQLSVGLFPRFSLSTQQT